MAEHYLSTTQTAQAWGISSSRVFRLAAAGRIPGAVQVGSRWLIPASASKPLDGRTREAKTGAIRPQQDDFFRYPSFEHQDLAAINPPLCEEELQMKASGEAFHACHFEKADTLLSNLAERTHNRYRRISALYAECMLDIFLNRPNEFLARYTRLTKELEEDFPHKQEMQGYLNEINATLGSNVHISHTFEVAMNYAYHASYLPHFAALCSVPLNLIDRTIKPIDLVAHEMNCLLIEENGGLIDLQNLHMNLCCAYALIGDSEKADSHMKKVLQLAQEHSLYYIPAIEYFYKERIFRNVLSEYPDDFRKRLAESAHDIHQRYLRFTHSISMNSIYELILHGDFLYVLYAAQGLTNKEVARILHVSESTVGKTYSDIYASLNVAGKKDLIKLYRTSAGENPLSLAMA